MSTPIELPQLPPPDTVQRHIDELKKIDLRTAEIDFIKAQLTVLFRGYGVQSPILNKGQTLYRGVRWSEKPHNVRDLSYPPAVSVKAHQRVNRPHQPMFYSSVARSGAIYELRPTSGDHFAISKWRTTEPILVNNIGYVPQVFGGLDSKRSPPEWGPGHFVEATGSNVLVGEYFATEFSKIISPSDEHLYKMSIAIAEKHYIGGTVADPSRGPMAGGGRFGGVVYPTIAMRANADNIALLPEFVDHSLSLISVEWVQIDSQSENQTFHLRKLDFANSFGPGGEIEWKGRAGKWFIQPGQLVTATVEDGRWIVKNEMGEIIDEM